MKTDDVVSFEKAMEVVSESIANLKRFTESLDKFLRANNIGSAEYSADYPAVSFRADTHGYDIAMFHLRDHNGEDVIYFYVYTDGTVQGENFSDSPSLTSRLDGGCTYDMAVKEILRTVGVLNHSALSREKIDKIVELLG